MLRELGYRNVRDYREGLADWVEAGEPLETAEATAPTELIPSVGPEPIVSADGHPGRGPARLSREGNWNDSLLELVDRLSTFQLFLLWFATVVICGVGYWAAGLLGAHGLRVAGFPVGDGLDGFLSSLYFSFVTATSVGYGDVVPVGVTRIVAVAEAALALLIFGAVIAKFVSHRQDELVREIHRITFDERLNRVQSNLHVVISELLSINSACEGGTVPWQRIGTQLDSAVLLFLAELRTTHDLLYQPRLFVEEGVLGAILANLASALEVLAELLARLPSGFTRSQPFELALRNLTHMAEDICGNCVPHSYTPRLTFWMDRIQKTSKRIH